MTITASEYYNARRGDAYSARERDYLTTGTGGDDPLDETAAILAAVAVSPATITSTDGNLVRTNANIAEVLSNNKMVITVQYGEAGYAGAAVQSVGTIEYQFSYQAPSERIFQSLDTISITTATGTENKDLFGGAIGVQKNADGTYDIEGVDTAPGNTTNTWQYTTVAISGAYEVLVEGMMGAVNITPFRGRPAGSFRFVSVSSQKVIGTVDKSFIQFGFQYIANTVNVKVGNITVPSKDGHDYLWVYRDPKEQTRAAGKKILIPYPQMAIVERVFPRANFSLLGL